MLTKQRKGNEVLSIVDAYDKNAVRACFRLVFAPIDEMFSDDAPLLPFGYRIIPPNSKSSGIHDALTGHWTLGFTFSLDVDPTTNQVVGNSSSCYNTPLGSTIAFQFSFENHLRDYMAVMAQCRGSPCLYLHYQIHSMSPPPSSTHQSISPTFYFINGTFIFHIPPLIPPFPHPTPCISSFFTTH